MLQVRVYPGNDELCLLAGYTAPELAFHKGIEAEPAGNGKRMASIGMMESRVLYVSADALSVIRSTSNCLIDNDTTLMHA